jgi:PAS domain S-box-containing protein
LDSESAVENPLPERIDMTIQLLIVEDESIIAKDLERNVKKRGYQVVGIAGSGQEALQMALELHPDLILMDIRLNGTMDGVEAAIRIQEQANVPVIYLTSHSDERTLERAKATQPVGYLVKPIDYLTLQASIEVAVYTHNIRTQLAESEMQYRTVLRTMLDGFILMDSTGHFVDTNEAFCNLLGYTREEILQMSLGDIEDAESVEFGQRLGEIIGLGADRFETCYRHKNGEKVDVDASVNYLKDKKRFCVFVRDITEQKRNRQKILQLNEDLSAQVEENARLYEEERKQRQLAETLVKASEALATSLDTDAVLDLILEQIGHVIENDVTNIVLMDDEKNTRTVRSRGYDTFQADVFIESFIFPLGGLNIRKQIIKTGKAIVVPDVAEDPRWSKTGAAWLRSYVAAPIRIQKKVIGFINVGSSLPGFYDESHACHLQTFAHQAAVAFQNARFFQEAQAHAERLQSLSRQLLGVQETERRYIARELHDEIGQALTATSLILQGIQSLGELDLVKARIKESLAVLNLALQQVRKMSLDLHPALLDDLGLIPALRWCADREAKWGDFQVQVQATEIKNLSEDVKLVCFRVAQEALTNVSRHAKAQHVTLELQKRKGAAHLTIHDDGRGFNVQEAMNSAIRGDSLGLLGMKERVMLVNGELEITSTPESGTQIHARFPIGAQK